MSGLRIEFFIIMYFAISIFGRSCDSPNLPSHSGPELLILRKDMSSGFYAYFDNKGNKVLGDYKMAFTDTLIDFAIVVDSGFFLINSKGEHLYEVFTYDNGPDYPAEGLYRILKDGKIGYVDSRTSKLLIEPIYECAHPFENGKARVSFKCSAKTNGEHTSWESEDWFYIDKKGKRIN